MIVGLEHPVGAGPLVKVRVQTTGISEALIIRVDNDDIRLRSDELMSWEEAAKKPKRSLWSSTTSLRTGLLNRANDDKKAATVSRYGLFKGLLVEPKPLPERRVRRRRPSLPPQGGE